MSSQGWSETLQAAFSLFNALPEAARGQAMETLGEIGQEVLALQEELAPRRTGFLSQGLTVAQAMGALRIRVGFPALGKGRNNRFYAIWMEYGRAAQTVMVTRSTTASPRTAVARKRLKAGLGLRKSYPLKITALAPRPFIHIDDRIDEIVDRLSANLWDKALANAGGNA